MNNSLLLTPSAKVPPAQQLARQLNIKSGGQAAVSVTIEKYYTDVNGTIIDKAAAPAAFQKKLPVFLFGNFDRSGGNPVGNKVLGLDPALVYLFQGVAGLSEPFLWTNPLNDLITSLNRGDVYYVYTDSYSAPSGFVVVVLSSQTASFASIETNTQTTQNDGKIGQLFCHSVSYQVDNVDQLAEQLQIVKFDNTGLYVQNQYDPNIDKLPTYKLSDFIDLKISFLITQYFGLYFNVLYETDLITLVFRLEKQFY